MRKSLIAAVAILVCTAAVAQEHHHPMSDAEFLKMLGGMSVVGTKSTIATGATVTVNLVASSFQFTPSHITVNQGDTLVINFSVPASDQATRHGILMETYIEGGVNVNRGQKTTITIQATQDGVFAWGCNVPDCGDGHTNMIGTLTVNKISNPAPSVTQISPNSGSTAGGTTVTISGANFQSGATVTFGGNNATNVSVTSSSSITATTPSASATGAVPVVVKNPDGQSVSFSSFNYTLAAPVINSVSPATGPTSGGTTFTISGSGFVAGATVTVGGRAAGQVNVVSATTITALSPLGITSEEAGLPEDVVVINPDGTRITKTGGFQYTIPALNVDSISPATGYPAGGIDVTLSGAGFNGAVVSSVSFGGVAATNVRFIDPVTIRVTAPAHAAGSVDVVVTIGGTSFTVHNGYTYETSTTRKRAARH
ncbi:MAG TPA: IPT/TIG domain-containing protein [Thermoanaerobaculia bacterium]|nr:IPT/TIG domain-containing protein [Thermoanaerobaculia bacterium]